MILDFYDTTTEAIFKGLVPKGVGANLVRAAQRKLKILQEAVRLDDLKSPPGNRLHELDRDRAGQHAIAVNKQFRICFIWTDAGPRRVEFTDYH